MRIWLCRAATVLGCLVAVGSYASAVEVAGELVVDVSAADYQAGSETWSNAGSYGDFTAVGNPTTMTIGESAAVVFDGASSFVGSDFAPDDIIGGGSRSIEAWVFNPRTSNEETVVSWGKRTDPEGSNMSFNYGHHGNYGAVGHWGGGTYDLGWVDNDFTTGAPEAYQWHHLVYTYDEEFTRVYADGQLMNEEDTVGLFGELDTFDETAIAIAAQWNGSANFDNLGDPAALEPALQGTLAIGQLRIHSEALTEQQIEANFAEEQGRYAVNPQRPDPTTDTFVARPLSAAPIHRYSFNNPVSDDATGAQLTDSIGGAHGVVVSGDFGGFPEFTGEKLFLPGGPSLDAPYGDLPNGLISGLEAVTIESWVTIEGSQNWSRIWDFGSNSPGGEDGELTTTEDDNGGNTQGLDYLMLSAQRGGNTNQHRVEWREEDPGGGGTQNVDFTLDKELPEDVHFAVVVGPDLIDELDFLEQPTGEKLPGILVYADGELVGQRETTFELKDINDVNNWLGRSNWTNDASFEGSFDEFRIYDYALSGDEIAGTIDAGPDELIVDDGPDLDNNDDGQVDVADLAIACANGNVAELQAELNLLNGDVDGDGVGFSDFLALSANFGQAGDYGQGDFDCSGDVQFADFLALSANFGKSAEAAAAAVPEPTGVILLITGLGLFHPLRRRRSG